MNQALDAVPGGVLALSEELVICRANRVLAELLGRDPADLVGAPLDSLLTGPSRILFQTHVYPALKADGRVEEVFLTFLTAAGESVPVLLNATRQAGPDETAYQALVVRIRARARWEAELLAATRALEAERTASLRLADKLSERYEEEQRTRQFRDAFIGVLSHELQTPITTIFGMSHLLSRGIGTMDPDTVAEQLIDIEAEADRLRRLTEDLLVLSRAEGGRLSVAVEPIVISHVVRGAVESERGRWRSHEMSVTSPRHLPLVLGEEVHVEQVVRNYVSNAAKYSPAGGTIEIALGAEDGGVAVRVLDSGPGLGGQSPEQLFELFYRAPEAIRQTGGAGIGLFVCRELIGAMGGRIWAINRAVPSGSGAEFGFWLPAAPEEA